MSSLNNKYYFSCHKSPKDKRDLLVKTFLSKVTLPAEINYRDKMTVIRSQGQEGSCCGFAACYLKEYMEKIDYNQFIALSPRFAYEESKRISGLKEGSTMKATAQALITKGICEDRFWPYVALDSRPRQDGADINAERFKVEAKYVRITKESQLKAALSQYGPILLGVKVYKNWYRQKDGHIPNTSWWERMQGVLGGHAITITGYSDKTREYSFINSWGDWGDKGFGYITYAHMKSILMDGYALVDIDDPFPYKLMTVKRNGDEHFPLPLIVKFINGKMWELVENFDYYRENGEVIKVPKGFLFDFASIPSFFWSWIGPPTGEYGPAALIHDFLLSDESYPKSKADSIFLECMEILKVPVWKRYIMYYACRTWHGFR